MSESGNGSAWQVDPKVWKELAAPLPPDAVNWRQDGRAIARDGKFLARFVAYVDSHFVRERLDSVAPGNWHLTLEPIVSPSQHDESDSSDEGYCAFKARLVVFGVVREDVGQGRDFKAAATDAFKRAAVRFGIAAELYDYGQNWVQVDGDGKYPRPVEDPSAAYARKHARQSAAAGKSDSGKGSVSAASTAKPTAAVKPAWAEDPNVAFEDDLGWVVKGNLLSEMTKEQVEWTQRYATKMGYTELLRAAADRLAKAALGMKT